MHFEGSDLSTEDYEMLVDLDLNILICRKESPMLLQDLSYHVASST